MVTTYATILIKKLPSKYRLLSYIFPLIMFCKKNKLKYRYINIQINQLIRSFTGIISFFIKNYFPENKWKILSVEPKVVFLIRRFMHPIKNPSFLLMSIFILTQKSGGKKEKSSIKTVFDVKIIKWRYVFVEW